jgi:hypothetical protein
MKALSYIKKHSVFILLLVSAFSFSAGPVYSYLIKAEEVRLQDAGGYFATDNVESALQQMGAAGGSGSRTEVLTFIISGNGAVISAGASGHKPVAITGTITKWEIVSTATGSIVVDVKKSTYAGYDTFATIAGTEKPTISSGTKGTDTSLTTWTASVTAGDRIQPVVDSADINGIVVLTIYITGS